MVNSEHGLIVARDKKTWQCVSHSQPYTDEITPCFFSLEKQLTNPLAYDLHVQVCRPFSKTIDKGVIYKAQWLGLNVRMKPTPLININSPSTPPTTGEWSFLTCFEQLTSWVSTLFCNSAILEPECWRAWSVSTLCKSFWCDALSVSIWQRSL